MFVTFQKTLNDKNILKRFTNWIDNIITIKVIFLERYYIIFFFLISFIELLNFFIT